MGCSIMDNYGLPGHFLGCGEAAPRSIEAGDSGWTPVLTGLPIIDALRDFSDTPTIAVWNTFQDTYITDAETRQLEG